MLLTPWDMPEKGTEPMSHSPIDARATRQFSHSIVVQQGLLAKASDFLKAVNSSCRAAIIADTTVAAFYGANLCDSLIRTGVSAELITVPPGESTKNAATFLDLIDRLDHAGVTRRTIVVALGGGVICDTAGFVASAYMRGIPYVNIPTTLLAQVDAAIGGKVAVNHASGKNLIGSFYYPEAVLIDPETLRSLPPRDISAGLAEMIKVAVIAPPDLFEFLENNIELVRCLDMNALEEGIVQAVRLKVQLVAQDPFEVDLRRVLNFGHTLGHPIEAAAGYGTYTHGEAISIGMAIATRLAIRRGICLETDACRLTNLLEAAGLPTMLDPTLFDVVLMRLNAVRRIRDGHLHFVLPLSIGETGIFDDVTEHELMLALRESQARD